MNNYYTYKLKCRKCDRYASLTANTTIRMTGESKRYLEWYMTQYSKCCGYSYFTLDEIEKH
jgi:hypothetical protein